MKANGFTLEQLAEKLNGKLWTKGDLKRVYLDRGHNTKKMSTKTYVELVEKNFVVKCFIECPSQGYNWIKSQQSEVIDGVYDEIYDVLNPSIVDEMEEVEQVTPVVETVNMFGLQSRVQHNRFGFGIVTEENEFNITVIFDSEGEKKFVKRFVNLSVVA